MRTPRNVPGVSDLDILRCIKRFGTDYPMDIFKKLSAREDSIYPKFYDKKIKSAQTVYNRCKWLCEKDYLEKDKGGRHHITEKGQELLSKEIIIDENTGAAPLRINVLMIGPQNSRECVLSISTYSPTTVHFKYGDTSHLQVVAETKGVATIRVDDRGTIEPEGWPRRGRPPP